jgi:hypothetical protein
VIVHSVWRRWDFLKRQKQKELDDLKAGRRPLKPRPRYQSSLKVSEMEKL